LAPTSWSFNLNRARHLVPVPVQQRHAVLLATTPRAIDPQEHAEMGFFEPPASVARSKDDSATEVAADAQ